MWNLLGPGIKPVSLALAGRFLSTVSPGKSQVIYWNINFFNHYNVTLGSRYYYFLHFRKLKTEAGGSTTWPSSHNYNWPLNNLDLNCKGPLIWIFFFSSKYYTTTWSMVGLWMWNQTHRTHGFGGLGKLYMHFPLLEVWCPSPLHCSRVGCS